MAAPWAGNACFVISGILRERKGTHCFLTSRTDNCIMLIMKLPVISEFVCLLSLAWVTSCTNLCQNVADFGTVYSGVLLTEPPVCFERGGKCFIRGQRALFRRTYVDHPYAIGKPTPSQFTVKPDSLGEAVYREVRVDKSGNVEFAEDSAWSPMSMKSASPRPLSKDSLNLQLMSVDEYSRKLTPHAVYSYPLAVLTFASVDVPLNLLGVGAVLGTAAVAIPAGAVYSLVSPINHEKLGDEGE